MKVVIQFVLDFVEVFDDFVENFVIMVDNDEEVEIFWVVVVVFVLLGGVGESVYKSI